MVDHSLSSDYFELTPVQNAAYGRARRHSRRVRVLRVLLPLVGALAVLGLATGVWISNHSAGALIARAIIAANSLTMQNPHLTGYADGRAYDVRASRAVQALDNPDIVELEQIEATIDGGGENEAHITALTGSFDSNANILILEDSITLDMVSGLRGELSQAKIDMNSNTMVSEAPVSFSSEGSTIHADRMEVDAKKEILFFEGSVRMKILPNSIDNESPTEERN